MVGERGIGVGTRSKGMRKKTEYLSPERKLVEGVADWLCERARREEGTGAMSLGHVLVVVPTAQSGRQLRLRLAREAERRGWGGVLPPWVMLPMQVIVPADERLHTASGMQLRAAFLEFVRERPRRVRGADGRTELKEWEFLFQAEAIEDYRAHLSFLEQLNDIWRILAGRGLLMGDVRRNERALAVLEAACGDELARWEQLAELEEAFFGFLHGRGLRHEAEAIHLAKGAARGLPSEVEEVVLPGLADPVGVLYDVLEQHGDGVRVTVLIHAAEVDREKFDGWGRPRIGAWTGKAAPVLSGIRNEDVVRAGTDLELAKRVAADFPEPESDEAIPALGLCDEELFPELSASFLNRGHELHNPERQPVSGAALGRLGENLIALWETREEGFGWPAFAAVLRDHDVLWRILNELPEDERGQNVAPMDVLRGLDVCQNAFLPLTVPAGCEFDVERVQKFDRGAFGWFQKAARVLLGKVEEVCGGAEGAKSAGEFVRRMLEWGYGRRRLGDGEEDQEFQAAADALREVLDEFDEAAGASGLGDGALTALLRKGIAEASYSREPSSKSALRTEGWLELPWSAADKVALAGFHEGAVPDSVMGHPFLPDSLRAALGLTSNEQRLARDTYLLKSLLDARKGEAEAVRAYVALSSNEGDIRRPSRLLFLVGDGELAGRTERLFGPLPAGEAMPGQSVAPGWRLALPDEVLPPGRRKNQDGVFSASAINSWLECPFTYLFAYGLDMRVTKEKTELEANDFGTLIHKAMEMYAREQLSRSGRGEEQLREEGEIAAAFSRIMGELRKGYGVAPSVTVRLQLDAAEGRLRSFARIQSMWAKEGWRVAEEPEFGFVTRPFEGEEGCDVTVKGSVDRIDVREVGGELEYRLIDFKTWDKKEKSAGRVLAGGPAQVAQAERLGLPTTREDKPKRLLTVQLPLYGRCLEKEHERFAGRITDYCYVILGKSDENVCVLGSAYDQKQFEAPRFGQPLAKLVLAAHVELAMDTTRTAIRRIRANIFWPPGPEERWKWDVKRILMASPEKDLAGSEWVRRQEEKAANLEGARR